MLQVRKFYQNMLSHILLNPGFSYHNSYPNDTNMRYCCLFLNPQFEEEPLLEEPDELLENNQNNNANPDDTSSIDGESRIITDDMDQRAMPTISPAQYIAYVHSIVKLLVGPHQLIEWTEKGWQKPWKLTIEIYTRTLTSYWLKNMHFKPKQSINQSINQCINVSPGDIYNPSLIGVNFYTNPSF